jgi:hypothetical protein
MPPGLSLGPPTRPEVRWRVQTPGTGLSGVTPLTDVVAAVARRGGNNHVWQTGPNRHAWCVYVCLYVDKTHLN